MRRFEWREKFLDAVSACCEEGKEAAEYVRAQETHIGFWPARKNVGAFWLFTGSIYLNSRHFSRETSLTNFVAWTLLIHEVKHLQQGCFSALSIYGELEAWQIQFRVWKRIAGRNLHPVLEEIISLPLNMDRGNLRRAQKLMDDFAGKMYGAHLYPLYPLPREIKYWLTRR